MMDDQQRPATSQEKIRTGGSGKVYQFDPTDSDQDIDAYMAKTDPPKAQQGQSRSTVVDLGIGAAKDLGNMFLDLGSLTHRIPGVSAATDALWGLPEGASKSSFSEFRKPLEYENTTQKVGSWAPTVAGSIPAAVEMAGARLLPAAAEGLHKLAFPAFTKAESRFALTRGLGRGTPRSVEGLTEAARTGGPRAASTLQKMEQAVGKSKPGWTIGDAADLLVRGGLGYGSLGTPAAIAGMATKVISKAPRGTVAQGVATAAPYLQGAAGGSGVLLARALASLFGGSDQPE